MARWRHNSFHKVELNTSQYDAENSFLQNSTFQFMSMNNQKRHFKIQKHQTAACNRKVNFEAMTHFWSQRMIKLPKNIETKKCTYIFFNLKSYVRQIYTFRHFLLYMYMQTKWGNVTLTFRSLGTSVTVQNLQNIGLSQ